MTGCTGMTSLALNLPFLRALSLQDCSALTQVGLSQAVLPNKPLVCSHQRMQMAIALSPHTGGLPSSCVAQNKPKNSAVQVVFVLLTTVVRSCGLSTQLHAMVIAVFAVLASSGVGMGSCSCSRWAQSSLAKSMNAMLASTLHSLLSLCPSGEAAAFHTAPLKASTSKCAMACLRLFANPPSFLLFQSSIQMCFDSSNASPPARKTYRLSQPGLPECRQQVTALLAQGNIWLRCNPNGSSVLFVKRTTGSLRMCMDFTGLFEQTVETHCCCTRDAPGHLPGAECPNYNATGADI